MTILLKLADGTTDCFESGNYKISRVKDMHPAIVSVSIFTGKRRIAKKTRPFSFWYKHITYKSKKVQALLSEIAKQAENQNVENTEKKEN